MTPARLLTEQNVTRSPFSWPYRQTDQGVRPYNATRGPFGAHQNVAKRGNSVRATPSLHPHARKAGGKQKPFSNPKKGEPKQTRQTINFSGQLSSSPRSKIVVVEQENLPWKSKVSFPDQPETVVKRRQSFPPLGRHCESNTGGKDGCHVRPHVGISHCSLPKLKPQVKRTSCSSMPWSILY